MPIWAQLNERVFDFLGSVTLHDLVEQQKTKPVKIIRSKEACATSNGKRAVLA